MVPERFCTFLDIEKAQNCKKTATEAREKNKPRFRILRILECF
jgi:hypothetical protein